MDRHGIAARIRGLIGGHEKGDSGDIAARLGVSELSLRMSVDELSPHPTIEVLAAIIRTYGIDPNWLLNGEYSVASHIEAASVEETGGREAVTRLLNRLIQAEGRPLRGSMPQFPLPPSDFDRLEN